YAGPALTVAGEQAGFEASFLMGTNALTVSTIPDIVTAGGMTLLATDGAYVLNEINTMCTGQNLAVDTVFEGNEENYEACVVALQVLNDGLLDLTTRGYQRNGSGSSSSEAGKSDEGAEISESGVNIRGAGDESGSKADSGVKKPYATSRPSYGKGQVEQVWENAKDPVTGKVYDPSGVEIIWDSTKPRNGQWDMGHIPGEKYSDMHQLYMDDVISKEEFLEWYRNPDNYRPELPSTNRSHNYE
ncbi:MAG: HNH/ENDO VII family nuclease, partial [Lachnospiraceae bacterium]|nr:HNH/ENDO VII family nuclease [Lachnospiraceae bacterium]